MKTNTHLTEQYYVETVKQQLASSQAQINAKYCLPKFPMK